MIERLKPEQLSEIPKSIANAPDADIWGAFWHIANVKNRMVSLVFVGERGYGKSYSMLEKADALYRTKDDKPLFKISQVCFTAAQFREKLNEDFEVGTVICLDDAALVLYSKDALKEVVKEIGKALMTIRRKNPIIIMTLPNFKLLEGHSRLFSDVLIEVQGRDEDKNQNLCKIQFLYSNSFTGEIGRKTQYMMKKIVHPEFGISYEVPIPDKHTINMPKRSLWTEYEIRKKIELDAMDAASLKRIRLYEKKMLVVDAPKVHYHQVLEDVKNNIALYLNPKTGMVDSSKIMNEYNGEGKPTIGMTMSKAVAKAVNTEREGHTQK